MRESDGATSLARRCSGTISLTTTKVSGPGPSEKKSMTRQSEAAPTAVGQFHRNLRPIESTSSETIRLLPTGRVRVRVRVRVGVRVGIEVRAGIGVQVGGDQGTGWD